MRVAATSTKSCQRWHDHGYAFTFWPLPEGDIPRERWPHQATPGRGRDGFRPASAGRSNTENPKAACDFCDCPWHVDSLRVEPQTVDMPGAVAEVTNCLRV